MQSISSRQLDGPVVSEAGFSRPSVSSHREIYHFVFPTLLAAIGVMLICIGIYQG